MCRAKVAKAAAWFKHLECPFDQLLPSSNSPLRMTPPQHTHHPPRWPSPAVPKPTFALPYLTLLYPMGRLTHSPGLPRPMPLQVHLLGGSAG